MLTKITMLPLLMVALLAIPASGQDVTVLAGGNNIPERNFNPELRPKALNGSLYYAIGNQLWVTDGVAAPTMVTDFVPDATCPGAPRQLKVIGEFFGHMLLLQDRSFYLSDGTAAGTTLFTVSDDCPDAFFGANIDIAGDVIYWRQGQDLWSADGLTPAKEITPPGEDIDCTYVLGDEFYFTTYSEDLWSSTGTLASNANLGAIPNTPRGIARLNGTLYVSYNDSQPYPTPSSYVVTKHVPGIGFETVESFESIGGFAVRQAFEVVGGRLVMQVRDSSLGMYSTDGSNGGATLLSTPGVYTDAGIDDPHEIVSVQSNGLVYFFETDTNTSPPAVKLKVTDGTVAGTQLLQSNILRPAQDFLGPHVIDGGSAFLAIHPIYGKQVFVSDGTPNCIVPNTSFEPGTDIDVLYNLGDKLILRVTEAGVSSTVTLSNFSFTKEANFVIAEDAANDSVVGMAGLASEFGVPDSYSIVSGNVGNAFAIDTATGKITVNDTDAIDFETMNSFTLEIAAIFPDDTLDYQATVEITDVDEVIIPEEILTMVIEDVEDLIQEGTLTQGQGNPIENFLTQALASINKGKTDKAISKIEDAIDRIQDLVDSGELSSEAGQAITDLLQMAIEFL